MAETSRTEDVKSPQEIEEGIISTQTLTRNPFTVLPKEIYVIIFDMLDNSTDKQNFMNAHAKLYELFKSKRVLFLFERVFEEVVAPVSKKDIKTVFGSYKEGRLVCHDWDNGIQRYFQLHEFYFKIDEREHLWSPGSTLKALSYEHNWELEPCEGLDLFSREDTNQLLEKFSLTHPPSKNPIFSRSITLVVSGEGPVGEPVEEVRRFRASVDTLLQRYGRHVWHCKIEMEETLDPEACICIGKWINLMPELKTLQLVNEDHNPENDHNPLSKEDLKEIEDTSLIQSEMKKLIFLKISNLPAIVFNKILGNIPQLERIQIKFFQGEESFLREFELKIERENLKEAFLTLKGFDDFKYLESSEPFPHLQKLVIAMEFETDDERKAHAYSKWPEWRMVFRILEEKFPALEDLSLRLPKAVSREDKMAAIDLSLESQLNLPKLKKLWLALPNLCSLDFLQPCKELEKCKVVLEHTEWGLKRCMELLKRRGREKINFNMDFKNMWESNIWEKFPKLYKLKIRAWFECRDTSFSFPYISNEGFDRFTYEKNGEERMYYEFINTKTKTIDKRSSVDYSSPLANLYQ